MVPRSLRFMFVVHFVADLVFAIPLFLFPGRFLTALGWTAVDPVASRIVAAALFGIGIQSLLSRNAGAAAFRELLGLKVIWSSTAAIGIALSAREARTADGLGLRGRLRRVLRRLDDLPREARGRDDAGRGRGCLNGLSAGGSPPGTARRSRSAARGRSAS